MRVKVPIMIQDPLTSRVKNLPVVEGFIPDEEFFLDGPVIERIAVVDFCPETSILEKSAIFKPPTRRRKRGIYSDKKAKKGRLLSSLKDVELYKPVFMQVSTFATVLKTLYLFEGTTYASPLHRKFGDKKVTDTRSHTLGRPVKWAFDSSQLLIVPRAGEWANAFYHRDSHSLQFFFFQSPLAKNKTIYSCLSRDIVAHETAHAIIDGIVPDLLDASTPQSLAIHEALADFTALLMAFDSHTLRRHIFKVVGSSLKKSSVFSSIAEEFGNALQGTRGLRDLYNKKNLKLEADEHTVKRFDPHEVSEVLSGALYSVLNEIYVQIKTKESKKSEDKEKNLHEAFSSSGRSIWTAARRLKRMVFRALDYLPPGEVSFADFGRAMIAVDYVAYPADETMRNLIRKEFVKRSIISDEKVLNVTIDFDKDSLKGYDVPNLIASDWAAYDFVNNKRSLLLIPEQVQFEVRPRLHLKKKYDPNHPLTKEGDEYLFKIIWDYEEKNEIGKNYPNRRSITVGTTLVLSWDHKKKEGGILARLTSDPDSLKKQFKEEEIGELVLKEYDFQRKDRDDFLKHLIEEGFLKLTEEELKQQEELSITDIKTEVIDNVLRVSSTGNFLHIIKRGDV